MLTRAEIEEGKLEFDGDGKEVIVWDTMELRETALALYDEVERLKKELENEYCTLKTRIVGLHETERKEGRASAFEEHKATRNKALEEAAHIVETYESKMFSGIDDKVNKFRCATHIEGIADAVRALKEV